MTIDCDLSANGATAVAESQQRRTNKRMLVWAVRISLIAVVLIAWEFASGRWVRAAFVSTPSQIGERLLEWFVTGEIWVHLFVTLEEAIAGFAAGAILGFAVGLTLGRSAFLSEALNPFISALNALPKVALAPLFILWFGIGLTMKIVLTITIVFFLVFYNTYAGARDVDEDLVNIAKTMGATRWQVFQKIIVPSALIWVLTGLRISIPYALIGAVVGEIFASNQGIGYIIQSSGAQFDTAGVFAGLIVLIVLASSFSGLLGKVEEKLFRWRRGSAAG